MKENNSVLLTNKIKHLILFKFNIFYRFLKPKKALQLQKKKKNNNNNKKKFNAHKFHLQYLRFLIRDVIFQLK